MKEARRNGKRAEDDRGGESQVKRFREAARELGADGSEEQFDAALKRVATTKPASKKAKPRKRAG